MEHLSDDELIASFMGATMTKRFYAGANHIVYKFPGKGSLDWWVEYDRNWDWLMPVVEKIESVRVDDDLYFSVEINRNGCRIYRSWTTSKDNHFGWHQTGNKLRSTYEAVVEFIKWYNKQSN